jgi:hypothetical protein
MPCLATIIALATPRLAIVILWLFTSWFRGVFTHSIYPLIGFFILPTTVLWYSAVHNWMGGIWGPWAWIGLVVAVLIDLGPMRRKKRGEGGKF